MMRGAGGHFAAGRRAGGPERDPVHLALNLPESVSKAAVARDVGARGFHGSKDKVLLVFRLLLKKPTDRPTDRPTRRTSERGTIIISSSPPSPPPLAGRLLSRRRRRRNGPPPLPLLSLLSLVSSVQSDCCDASGYRHTCARGSRGTGPFKEFATLFRPTLIAEEDEGRSLLQEGLHAFLKRF